MALSSPYLRHLLNCIFQGKQRTWPLIIREGLPGAPVLGTLTDALYPNFTTRLLFGCWRELTEGTGLSTESGPGEMGLAIIRGLFCYSRRGGSKGDCPRMSFRDAQRAPVKNEASWHRMCFLPGWPPPSGLGRRCSGKLGSGFWVGEWARGKLRQVGKPEEEAEEEEGSSAARPGSGWRGAAGTWPSGPWSWQAWLGKTYVANWRIFQATCGPDSVQQVFPKLPLLCACPCARCRNSDEPGSFSWCSESNWLCPGDGWINLTWFEPSAQSLAESANVACAEV